MLMCTTRSRARIEPQRHPLLLHLSWAARSPRRAACAMPHVALDTDKGEVVITLSNLEKVGALLGDVHVALTDVASAYVAHEPWRERPWAGLRVGTGLPFVVLLGRLVSTAGVDFVAVYGTKTPALVLQLKRGARWRRVVVTLENAVQLAQQVTRAVEALPPPPPPPPAPATEAASARKPKKDAKKG